MSAHCKLLGFLLLLHAFTAYSETTKDAKEEEEDDFNIVPGNESSKTTSSYINDLLYRNFSTSESPGEYDLSWLSDFNYTTDSDPEVSLRTTNIKDSTFENGLDSDADDEVHSSHLLDIPSSDVLPSIIDISPTVSISDVSSSFTVISELVPTQTSSSVTSELICDFKRGKCSESSFKQDDKSEQFATPTPVLENATLVWDFVKTTPSQVASGFLRQPVMEMQNHTVSSSQSSTAQTSENVIPVERTPDGKDELLPIANHSAKSEKTKQAKSGGLSDSEGAFRTSSKVEPATSSSETQKNAQADSLSENGRSVAATTIPPRNASSVETEYVISNKTVIPTVEYVHYVNHTEASKNTQTDEIHETVSSDYRVPSSSIPSKAVHAQKDTESFPTPHLRPSFTETFPEATTSFTLPSSIDITDTSTSTIRRPQQKSFMPVTTKQDTTTDEEEISPPPPRLTNPPCSSLPTCVEVRLVRTTWDRFCRQAAQFRRHLASTLSTYTRPLRPHHIVLDAPPCEESPVDRQGRPDVGVSLAFYVTDDRGEYEEIMTEICYVVMRKRSPEAFEGAVLEVRSFTVEALPPSHPILPEVNSGFVAAVTISSVAGVALCLLCVLLVVMKQRFLQSRSPAPRASPSDAYSLDSLSINASFRTRRVRRSGRSYLNHAFDDLEIASHPLNEKSLMNCLKDKDLLEDEFKKIPMNTAKLDQIPEGADVKNRYSNVLPKPETRVILAESSGDPLKSYINANYVKGYDGKASFYIACQAPLPEGIEDFWRMVWEQQSRVIIMLTMLEENGVSRCAQYFPQSSLVTLPPFGDFQISLLKKEVYEFYTMSTFRLFDLERNLFREVTHLWYVKWPAVGVPSDPSSLVTFLLQCKPYIDCNSGPTIVHCSTGTGRTGVFLALDICMREYEDSRSVDILQCVMRLRRDRGGAVQNKDQFLLIYEAMLEHASRIANQSQRPSIRSNN